MDKTPVQSRVGIHTVDINSAIGIMGHFGIFLRPPGQVADRGGNDADVMTGGGKKARQLVMAGAAGFIQSRKCLVYEQDMHDLILTGIKPAIKIAYGFGLAAAR